MVFEAPVLNEHGKGETLQAGEKYASIGTIEIPLKDLNYYYNGNRQTLIINTPLYVYDVTDGNQNLVKECTIFLQQRETTTFYYPVLRVPVSNNFFSGRKYKLLIPHGTISVSNPLIQKYVTNSEWSFEFEGDTPLEVKLTDCTLQNDTELSEISSVVWTFKGEFVCNPELTVQLLIKKPNPVIPGAFLSSMAEAVTAVQSQTGSTRLVGTFYDILNGGPLQLDPKNTYQVILPEGLIYYAGDPSIKNERMTIDIVPVEKVSNEPEFVDVTLVTNDFMTTTQKAVKGKTFTYKMTFDAKENEPTYWGLKSAKQGNTNLAVANGIFVIPSLKDATEIDLEVEYTGEWSVNVSTDVWEIKGENPIRIYKDADMIVVEGVNPDNTINVYNVAGMLINTTRTTDGNDIVRISVSKGQYYIVTVDGVATKILMN